MSGRTIPPGHRSITGALPSLHSAKPLQYESKLERDFLMLMEIEWWLISIATQPVTIDLDVDGQARRYTPDVLVTWHPDCAYPFRSHQVLFEVKPLDVLRRDFAKLAPKYMAARRYFRRLGMDYRVVTERTIRVPRLANAMKIVPAARQKPSEPLFEAICDALLDHPYDMTMGRLRDQLESAGFMRSVAVDGVYSLIGSGRIHCDLHADLNDASPLYWWTVKDAEVRIVDEAAEAKARPPQASLYYRPC